MYYVYVIESTTNGRRYTGSTENIDERLKNHNSGKVRSTKAYRPYKIVYTEEFGTRTEARKKENFLKSGVGRKFLDNLIAELAERCVSG